MISYTNNTAKTTLSTVGTLVVRSVHEMKCLGTLLQRIPEVDASPLLPHASALKVWSSVSLLATRVMCPEDATLQLRITSRGGVHGTNHAGQAWSWDAVEQADSEL